MSHQTYSAARHPILVGAVIALAANWVLAFAAFLVQGADPTAAPWWLLTGGLASVATLIWGIVRVMRRETAVGLTIVGVSLVACVVLIFGTLLALVSTVGS